MKCGFCHFEFDQAQAADSCCGCPLTKGCHLVCCPRCGYEMPPEAKLVSWLRGLSGRSRKLPARSADSFSANGSRPFEVDAVNQPGLIEDNEQRPIVPLSDMQPGRAGSIAHIEMNDPRRLQKLIAMNLLPGVPVRLLRRSPSYVFEAGCSQFALDEEIAADIYVRLKPK